LQADCSCACKHTLCQAQTEHSHGCHNWCQEQLQTATPLKIKLTTTTFLVLICAKSKQA
jgi:hypothetical protein